MLFDWDEHNTDHIARHGVTPDQVEEALRLKPLLVKREVRSDELRIATLGRIADGRILFVVTTPRNGKQRPVTAWYASGELRDIYITRTGSIA